MERGFESLRAHPCANPLSILGCDGSLAPRRSIRLLTGRARFDSSGTHYISAVILHPLRGRLAEGLRALNPTTQVRILPPDLFVHLSRWSGSLKTRQDTSCARKAHEFSPEMGPLPSRPMLHGSQVVRHPPVKRVTAGSNPARAATCHRDPHGGVPLS